MLYKHQQELLDRNPPRQLIAWSTGTGKTKMALELVKKNNLDALIIVPKMLKENWRRECAVSGVMALICSKEEFRNTWKDLPGYNAVIVDEAHHFGNLKSQLSKALIGYCRKWQAEYRWLLTATPYLSSPWNIYALATHLGVAWPYLPFKYEFFNEIWMGPRLVPVIKKGVGSALAKRVAAIGTTAKLEDLIDVPSQVHEVEYFTLTREQQRAISEIQETNYIARWTKTHTIENGVLYDDAKETTETFLSDKTDRIKELCTEDNKVAIFCRYNGQINYLEKELKDSGKPIFKITGETKDRAGVVDKVEALSRCIVLINASCAEGYELPSIGTIIFASLSFKYADFVQAQGRFLRINKPKRNLFITLVADGVDKMVYESIKRKEDFSLKIFECHEWKGTHHPVPEVGEVQYSLHLCGRV